MFFRKCKKCEALEKETAYLKTLVDRLLEHVKVNPVDPSPFIGSRVEGLIAEQEEPAGAFKETFGEP